MMVLSPIGGSLINRVGPRKLISFGMIVTGIGGLLLLRADVDASYLAIVPGFVVMGFGMSFIWAPMTTAMLNSVESAKSGVASAVNGAIREIGTAFGIALLGTTRQPPVSDGIPEQARDSGSCALNSAEYVPAEDARHDRFGRRLGGNFIDSLPGTEQLGSAVESIQRSSGDRLCRRHGARDLSSAHSP